MLLKNDFKQAFFLGVFQFLIKNKFNKRKNWLESSSKIMIISV